MIFGDATPASSRIFLRLAGSSIRSHGLKPLYRSGRTSLIEHQNASFAGSTEFRSPCGHSQFAAWSNATPEFAHSFCHIGHKENSEHAHDGIKTRDWKPHREHIADFEFDVAKTPLNCFRPRRLQKLLCKVNSYDVSLRSDCLRSWQSRSSGPATNIEDSRTTRE